MTSQIEYNARSIPSSEVARSFIPPERHFMRLLSRNHTLILGPRGSGKTTLLKMLTVRALRGWGHPRAPEYISHIGFNGAFIPADVAWGRQIDALEGLGLNARRTEAAFVLHTLRALVHAMRQSTELGRSDHPNFLNHLAADLSAEAEEHFVGAAAAALEVTPTLRTLLGLELTLESRLNSINQGQDVGAVSVDSFASSVSLLVSTFNALSENEDRRWALLFDELEIAPSRIKQALLSGIRSIDERLIIKLAMAPFMEDAGFELSPTSPQALHDYQTVELSYPNKDDAAEFTSALVENTFARLGSPIDSLSEVFEEPDEIRGYGRRADGRRRRRGIPDEFLSLVEKDTSFRSYVDKKGIFSPDYVYSEENLARDVRKVLPIVKARDYYLSRFDNGRVTTLRSRKAHLLYVGYPSILELTEGNPRAILTLIGPLIQEWRDDRQEGAIPSAMQAQAIRRVELLLTSLLQVIPLDLGGFEPGKGLLDFVDRIGRTFEHRLLREPFAADYVGTFVLDDNVTDTAVTAVGRALNAGALVHVPFADSSHDALLRGLRGQRFRLSYALAPRYRLLLTLGERISLSKLLAEGPSTSGRLVQASLFDLDRPNDH